MMTSTQRDEVSESEVEDVLARLDRQRRLKKRGALTALVLAGVSLLGLTYLAYTETPNSVPAGRIGAQSMQSTYKHPRIH